MKNHFSLTKLNIIASCILISSISIAMPAQYKNEVPTPCPDHRLMLNGLYVGAQGGYDMYKIKSNYNVSPLITIPPTTMSGSISKMADNGIGGLFIGYGMEFEEFYRTYLGLEVFGNWIDKTTTYNQATNGILDPAIPAGGTLINEGMTIKARVRGNVGISLLPGIKLNDATLLYARLGYNWTQITVNQTAFADAFDESDVGSVTPIGSASLNSSRTKYVGGFNYGLGIETRIYQNLSGRIDYSYAAYSDVHGLNFTHVHTSDNRVMLGLVYRNITF